MELFQRLGTTQRSSVQTQGDKIKDILAVCNFAREELTGDLIDADTLAQSDCVRKAGDVATVHVEGAEVDSEMQSASLKALEKLATFSECVLTTQYYSGKFSTRL